MHLISLLQYLTDDERGSIEYALKLASGIFSLILFAITIFAWLRRGRQTTLLIVAIAFLAFASKQIVEILPLGDMHDELFSSLMDFVVLALFFVALVVRPQRRVNSHSVQDFCR